ncbi:hypothetical protein GCM10025883_18990 [Mobilicoccus caccae]|uniref:VWFA domain-containing protein n=1 Tax=Mobilicoccus caccae TaxID=1859295 RepID=A0ABQ6ISZ2_9MICO|nr:hypothetical protein GCM10025883_18990 [Mobilicoccus caccae]
MRAVHPEDPRGRGLALTSTVLAAATRGTGRGEGGDAVPGVDVGAQDLRRSVRRGKEGNLVVFAVDTSGSMGAAERIRQVKTACVSLLMDAYQRRDKVAVVTFAKKQARVVLPPTSSVELAQRLLADVPTGGRTPLAEGLTSAYDVIRRERVRDPHRRALLVVLTDGRASAGGRTALPRAHRVARGSPPTPPAPARSAASSSTASPPGPGSDWAWPEISPVTCVRSTSTSPTSAAPSPRCDARPEAPVPRLPTCAWMVG